MTDKPTPPDGYEVMLGKDLPLPVPVGCRRWRENYDWTRPVTEANHVEISANYLESWYAVPAQKPAPFAGVVTSCPLCGKPECHCWEVPSDSLPAGTDPKKAMGDQKPQLQLIPPTLNNEVAKALARGAEKYGVFNWRENRVEAMTYLGAMKRHIDQFLDGEDIDPGTGAHHLGCVAAGCGIVLDARQHGTLVDNRPPKKQTV